MPPNTGDASGPVDAVKELQRTDRSAREQWVAYCDQHGDGLRDPSRHDASFLEAFLSQFHAGHVDVVSEAEILVKVVKAGQRASEPWRQSWEAYCRTYGGGLSAPLDPSKHERAFLKGFLDLLGKQGNAMLGGGSSGNADKEALVERVKAFQRSGKEKQALWADHCDGLGGAHDPNRHDASALQAFCTENDVPQAGPSDMDGGRKGAWKGGMKGSGKGDMKGSGKGDDKSVLVQRIKAFQRLGEEQKGLWAAHCDDALGGVRDPMRHDASALRVFCAAQRVPEAKLAPPSSSGAAGGDGSGGANKMALVERIKAFQRLGAAQKGVWAAHCDDSLGGARDPMRHEASALGIFCAMHDVPAARPLGSQR